MTTLNWLETGREWHAKQAAEDHRHHRTVEDFERIIAEDIETMTWHDVPPDGIIHGPMSPILMLQEIIQQMELRHVVSYSYNGSGLEYPDGPETATYSLLGVEIKTRTQHFKLYLMDTGLHALFICAGWIEGTPA